MSSLMRHLEPATWPWLLLHELRLGWRDMGKSATVVAIVVSILWVFLHLAGWFVMRWLTLNALMRSPGMVIAGMVCWLVLTMMLSASISMAVKALFDRGDLDLLISSPLSARTVFTVRGIGIALRSTMLPALFVLPFAHMGAISGQWGLLAVYPVLLVFGLGSAGLAFALTLILVRLLGVRRARVSAQIIGAAAGAAVFLISQAQNFLSDSTRQAIQQSFTSTFGGDLFSAHSMLWWPVRALFGDPLPFIFIVPAGVLIFILVIHGTYRSFLFGSQEAVWIKQARKPDAGPLRFRSGLTGIVIRKELLLIARDPNLITQSLLQVLYLTPLAFLIFRVGDTAHLLAPGVILLCSTLAGNLAFLTVCGEEAFDLIASAPVSTEHIRWLKVAAALLPVCMLATPFAVFYFSASLWEALVFVVCFALAMVSVAVLQVWSGKNTGKRDLRQRTQSSKLLTLVETMSAFGWAAASYGLMVFSWWAAVGILLGLVAPLWAFRGRNDRQACM